MKVLIVDDDFVSRGVVQTILSHYEISDVDVAESGNEAFEAFYIAHERETPYQLIFLDIIMPSEDSLESIERIRNLEREENIAVEKRVKIIGLSIIDSPEDIKNYMNKGFDSFISKPLTQRKLQDAFHEISIEPY